MNSLIEASCDNYKPILGDNIWYKKISVRHPVIGNLSRCYNSTNGNAQGNNCLSCNNRYKDIFIIINPNKIMEELKELVTKLSDGNVGAATILIDLVDDNPIPAIVILNKLNELNIIGTNIYVLGRDICNKDYQLMAYLCNKVPNELLIEACSKQDYSGQDLLKTYITNYNIEY